MSPTTAAAAITVILAGASVAAGYAVFVPSAIDPATLSAEDGYLRVPKEACRTGPDLPDRIPDRFVIQLIPLDNQRLSRAIVDELQNSLNDAYWFLDFEAATGPVKEPDVQVIPAYVTINNQIISPKGKPALGLECHNQIFLMHREGRPGVITSTIIHEVGHVLGLTHEDNTWMHAQGTSWGIPQHAQRWNMDQFNYLMLWDDAGFRLPDPYEA